MAIHGRSWKQFGKDLKNEVSDDNVTNGAAALAFYFMLSIFPAMIALLSVVPYLPVQNVDQAVMDFLRQGLPGDAANMFTSTVQNITQNKQGGLLSIGILLTLWSASAGMYALMQQLNITYDVKEDRPFWKGRGIALLLTAGFGLLLLACFGLVVFGGVIQDWVRNTIGSSGIVTTAFALLRWGIIISGLLLGLGLVYRFAPNVEGQKFRFITPGAVLGVVLLVAASLGFRYYVDNFGSYQATYGSIGAVIVLMLWLNIMGLVVLLGSEVNALIEHYSAEGKEKGEQVPRRGRAA